MYNSILQLAINLTEKICERAESGEIRDLDVMSDKVLSDCKETSAKIIQEIIHSLNECIREDKQTRRKLGLVMKEKDRPRQLFTALGTICFERDYFYDRKNGSYMIPLDRMMGIEKRERISGSVRAALIAQATDSSYAKSSAIVTGGEVSRQTVHDQILKMDVPEAQPYEEHKQVSQLHIYADEDHAHMQKPGKEKGKKNKAVPLVTVTEGTVPGAGGRNRTIHPMHFSDEGFDTKNLWKKVSGYIARAYDTEGLEKIYIHGDGGGWIKSGLEEYPQSVHVMDGYHFFKALKAICRILPERNIRIVILEALRKDDKRKADLFLQELLSGSLREKESNQIRIFAVYLFREWDAIRRRILEDVPGSCTEGQISHVLSKRFSRDPLGWSEEVLGKLVGARLYLKNGGTLTKEIFSRAAEKEERYSEYADRMISEVMGKAYDFSIFEPASHGFDGGSGTQIAIRGVGKMRAPLFH